MDPILRIDLHEEMDVVREHLELQNLGGGVVDDLLYNGLEPDIYPVDQNTTPILGTPDHVIFTGVGDVVIGFVVKRVSWHTAEYTA